MSGLLRSQRKQDGITLTPKLFCFAIIFGDAILGHQNLSIFPSFQYNSLVAHQSFYLLNLMEMLYNTQFVFPILCSIQSPLEPPDVANAISILQACIYKFAKTGLSLKTVIAPRVVKCNSLMLVFTFKHKVLSQKSMIMLN